MSEFSDAGVAITGVGVTSAIGQGRDAFAAALFDGAGAFGVMARPGRQNPAGDTRFLGAELGELAMPSGIEPRELRHVSLSARVALATLDEAWRDAALDQVDPERIALVVGGSNLQQREQAQVFARYAGREAFVSPAYAMSFMDTDLCGVLTRQFGIKGSACTVGGASASGQLAVIHAAQAVRSGQCDVAIALGALMDLSHWECQALRSLGAMGSDRFAEAPGLACRPFDLDHDGFIYGECCAALVVERIGRDAAPARGGVQPYARLAGWHVAMDANRNPDPSLDGEKRAIDGALRAARLSAAEIDYVNPHGTGSLVGDATELAALRESGLAHARLNATKSLVGHGLTAAGAVEVVATLVQMRAHRLHPTRNLEVPIDAGFGWVGAAAQPHTIHHALTLSMGFGGINTALCLTRIHS
ncbi:MAG: beta-ketoacyl synthase N-terminal-like domain-containing protein [Burkholderia gladioli]|uniref:beta-ketoacyl synthase N-terminal-like domain-containing protein n=1 Tax=Burkholderia gladioli TaxID=28095 RepID=UPI00163FA46C|nr:beta-ketoacyl synthase N-terminal-like domain-containing protein [Burkholderia gladioli]